MATHTFTQNLSQDLTIGYTINDPKTQREEMEADPYTRDYWVDASEEEIEDEFPSKLYPDDIKNWRRKVGLTLTYRDQPVISTSLSQVQHMSYSDMQAMLSGKDLVSQIKKYKLVIANRDEIENPKFPFTKGFEWDKWFVFVDQSNKKPSNESIIVAIPDVNYQNVYGFPENNYYTYNDILDDIRYQQNHILNDFRDKIGNPAEEAVKELRERTHLSQEAFAKKAGISKTTLVKAESGGNVSVDVLMKLATAGGKFLTVKFE